jgi:glutaconate CoA-transferase subunit B
VVLIYESGTIGAKPDVLPLSIGDGELAEHADTVVSVPEIFRYWLQGGRIDVGFLGAAQVDRYGNINTTVIGPDYAKPKVRLPGAGGAPEIASNARETWIIIKQTKRSFVPKLDFMTSVGHLEGGDSRARSGARGAGPTAVITDLGILTPDPVSRELTLTALHPGITVEQARASTGWDLKVVAQLARTAAPTRAELETLRELQARTARAHGTAGVSE